MSETIEFRVASVSLVDPEGNPWPVDGRAKGDQFLIGVFTSRIGRQEESFDARLRLRVVADGEREGNLDLSLHDGELYVSISPHTPE